MTDAPLPLEAIEFDTPIKPATDLGQPGELMWIEVGKLVIDPRYQRPLLERGKKNIRHIAEHFRWAQFSPLVVVRRGDKFAAIDGQHRGIAAIVHGGIDKVPCLVISGTAEDEALSFATINGQVTAVLPTQIYYAKLAGGEPKAIALKEACDAAGVTILRTPKAKPRAGETAAVTTLEVALRKHGRNVLVTALQTITQTGDGNAGFLTAPVIEGTCEVLAMNERWRAAGHELFKAVERISIPRIYNLALRDKLAHKGASVKSLFVTAMKQALAKEIGQQLRGAELTGAKPVSAALLNTNAREVLLALADYSEPVSADEVAQLVEVGKGRVPGLLTSLAQMNCARATAGRWDLTAIGRATAQALKVAMKGVGTV